MYSAQFSVMDGTPERETYMLCIDCATVTQYNTYKTNGKNDIIDTIQIGKILENWHSESTQNPHETLA